MEISLRSYLTAGISLTAASAIAFTPLMIPANEKALTIPSVSVSDVQLVVTTEEIEEFIANLQGALDDVTETVAGLVAIPGQTLADVIAAAAELNNDLYTALIDSTDNATLQGLLTALNFYSTTGLVQLAGTVEAANNVLVITLAQTTTLLTSALTGSLQNVLIAVNNIVNDPLAFSNYAGLLGAGIASGELLGYNGLEAVQGLGNGLFAVGGIGLGGFSFQVNNAITGLNAVLSGIGAASGIGIVEAAIAALQGIVIAPALGLFNIGVGTIGDVVGGAAVGFNVLVEGAQGVTLAIGDALQSAIFAIGTDPLDPANYASALGALTVGGFSVFNTLTLTGGALAEVPIDVFRSLNTTFTGVLTSLTLQIGTAASTILAAVGLPEEISNLPLEAAASINEVIAGISGAVADGLDVASGLISDGVTLALEVSSDLETGALDLLGNPVIPPPPILVPPAVMALQTTSAPEDVSTASRIAPEGSGNVVAAVNEVEEDAPEEEAPGKEAPADDNDSAGSDDDSDSDSDSDSATSNKRTDRGERAGSKADRSNSKSDKDSGGGSDSGSGNDGGSEE